MQSQKKLRIGLSLQEAAEQYGMSTKTIRRRIADGTLVAYRVGPRSIRVTVADLEALATRIPTATGDGRTAAT